ncbi:MAG: C40 family peptidase [Oscillospiraceae bacterium]|nr:C40 family peptidase [Oscillospiraceae bacterium]
MKEQPSASAPKLIFADEERQTAGLEKSIADVERGAAKTDRMKARLRMEHGPKKKPAAGVPSIVPDATAGEMPEKPAAPRLLFSDEARVKVPGKTGQGIIGKTVSSEVHRQIAQDEEDNTGLQALHATERTSESALHTVQQVRQSALQHDHKELAQAEKRLDHANIRFLQREHEIKHPEHSRSNPLSRAHQRRAIKNEYMAAKAGRSTGAAYGAKRNAQKAVKKTSEATESVAAFIVKHKHFVVVFALVAMLMFLMNALSSCTPLLQAGLQAFVMGTYPAEEADIKAAERTYKTKEDELKQELEHYELYHPGYDEYIIEADISKIWHDPYALISIISAYHGGEEWWIDDVYSTIDMLFNWQYKVTETISSKIRYRTVEQQGTRLITDPVTGDTHTETYTYTVSVPYAYSICTISLATERLSHAPVYVMSREKMGLYALYMSTLGNMSGIFDGNLYASKLEEPMVYEVPKELLDADPQFAMLVEAANKCLGYPYVWGGYDPSTSFDCSGFISWLFTSTGINNIGHMGATGLYGHSDPIQPEDARPGDVIFFQGTMGDDVGGITHCGLYVGNNMMIHCGNPCSYANLTDAYWQQHLYGFGRLYDH